MKYLSLIWLFALTVLISSCHNKHEKIPADVVNIPNSASGDKSLDQLPVISFKETSHDFGKVIQGEIVSYAFHFTNTGKSDLLIADVSASCGCTATKYPKEPVKPGEEKVIEVTFDSSGREGYEYKTVTIAANTQPNTTVISIKAQVVIPERNSY